MPENPTKLEYQGKDSHIKWYKK